MKKKAAGSKDNTTVCLWCRNSPVLFSLPWWERARERGNKFHFVTLSLTLSPQGRGNFSLMILWWGRMKERGQLTIHPPHCVEALAASIVQKPSAQSCFRSYPKILFLDARLRGHDGEKLHGASFPRKRESRSLIPKKFSGSSSKKSQTPSAKLAVAKKSQKSSDHFARVLDSPDPVWGIYLDETRAQKVNA